jgi:hypothetical protein
MSEFTPGPDDEPPDWWIALLRAREDAVDHAIAEVVRAWAIGYPDKRRHDAEKNVIRKEFPRLYVSLERLVRSYREINSEPPKRYGAQGEFPF